MAPAVLAFLARENVPADPTRRERSGKAARGRALVGRPAGPLTAAR
jgi:hypothetical protein